MAGHASDDARTERSDGASETPPAGRLLVVDAEPQILDLLSIVFEHAGYLVNLAEDPHEARNLIASQDVFDVALMDLWTHRKAAEDLIHLLSNLPPSHQPAIFGMVSRRPSPNERKRYLQLGVVDIIAKPFKIERLKSVVRSASHSVRLLRT